MESQGERSILQPIGEGMLTFDELKIRSGLVMSSVGKIVGFAVSTSDLSTAREMYSQLLLLARIARVLITLTCTWLGSMKFYRRRWPRMLAMSCRASLLVHYNY